MATKTPTDGSDALLDGLVDEMSSLIGAMLRVQAHGHIPPSLAAEWARAINEIDDLRDDLRCADEGCDRAGTHVVPSRGYYCADHWTDWHLCDGCGEYISTTDIYEDEDGAQRHPFCLGRVA